MGQQHRRGNRRALGEAGCRENMIAAGRRSHKTELLSDGHRGGCDTTNNVSMQHTIRVSIYNNKIRQHFFLTLKLNGWATWGRKATRNRKRAGGGIEATGPMRISWL